MVCRKPTGKKIIKLLPGSRLHPVIFIFFPFKKAPKGSWIFLPLGYRKQIPLSAWLPFEINQHLVRKSSFFKKIVYTIQISDETVIRSQKCFGYTLQKINMKKKQWEAGRFSSQLGNIYVFTLYRPYQGVLDLLQLQIPLSASLSIRIN